ncbi:MAG: PDZ domain-containing protein [Gemmatimonadetes bacterium]|nr:PDZ domain-containing protein [Gemmatimonadota bacterium]
MIRKTVLGLALALVLALPSAGQSQNDAGGRRSGRQGVATAEAQEFLAAFQIIRDYGLEVHSDSTLWFRAVDGLIRELNDAYAQAFAPAEYDEFQENNTGSYAGIGVQITTLNEVITVTAVFRGTPAEESGLQVGDLIIAVNDESTEGWTTGDASDAIRGEVGTTVQLSIARQGLSAPLRPTVRRDSVHVEATEADLVGPNVAYIGLDRVARGSADEVEAALSQFKDARGFILDLRGNPGGYLDESLDIADLFLPEGVRLASAESRVPGEAGRSLDESWTAETPDHIPGKPMIVLVNRFSASASEIIAGALQDHDRALVIGERTFGKGVFQNVFQLSETRHLRITTGEWFTPLGRSLHRPRTAQGNPLPEDPDNYPVITTRGGRELVAGGGVFPDLEIRNDTLTVLEREFISQTDNAGVPLSPRIEEFSFEQSQKLRAEGGDPVLDPVAFEDFLTGLAEEGADRTLLDSGEVREYLEYQVGQRIARRMDRLGRAMELRALRDPVLATALQLLGEVETQEELFAAADRLN